MTEPFPVAVLCGGYGTRLYPLTERVPKVLVDVNGRPFLHHILALLNRRGYRHVVLCTGVLADQVKNAVDPLAWPDMRIRYSDDGPTPLGTAGSLIKASPLLGTDFMVLYGDSYLPCDMADIQADYESADSLGLMAVCRPPPGYRPNVHYSSFMVLDYDKRHRDSHMEHIDYGLSVLDSGALALVPPESNDLADLFCGLARLHELAGYEVRDRFHTIGTPAGLAETRAYLGQGAW